MPTSRSSGAGDERVEQDRRGRRGAVDVDLLAALDAGHGLARWDDAHLDPIFAADLTRHAVVPTLR